MTLGICCGFSLLRVAKQVRMMTAHMAKISFTSGARGLRAAMTGREVMMLTRIEFILLWACIWTLATLAMLCRVVEFIGAAGYDLIIKAGKPLDDRQQLLRKRL